MINSDGKLSQFAWNSSPDDGKIADNPHSPSPIPKATASMVTILAKDNRLAKGLLLHLVALESKVADEYGGKYSKPPNTGLLD